MTFSLVDPVFGSALTTPVDLGAGQLAFRFGNIAALLGGRLAIAPARIAHHQAKETTMQANPVRDMQDRLADSVAEADAGRADRVVSEETLGSGRNLDSVMRIPVTLQVVLGSATIPVANLMKLGRGAVVPLDHRVGEPVEVVVNGRVIARGEVVVVEDDNSRFGVSLTEIVGPAGSELSA